MQMLSVTHIGDGNVTLRCIYKKKCCDAKNLVTCCCRRWSLLRCASNQFGLCAQGVDGVKICYRARERGRNREGEGGHM